ncbi:acetamidase/formamidase family protein [Nocardioides marmotae]|uniref:acetamidase/formamidase family protein n=1 Tax=Nocardioides marmotae TaxID=2663857 RepID=UPI0012B552EC|nr:acetamidase/formamidase family protein [Nocardioides marmotae]MBC9733138.1 acetamidase/formamidase family protein [Nocardioides marmotae]MTB84251.1 acetamidase [Nocardioides marmotae]
MDTTPATPAATDLSRALVRRAVLRATAAGAIGSGAALAAGAGTPAYAAPSSRGVTILQPGQGKTRGRYVRSRADEVWWGHLPNHTAKPVAVVDSGTVVTIDTISHEGLLEDQGKDPRQYFETFGVPEKHVLRDAVAVAARAEHAGPGPHVVTGPIAVRGAEPGDVLKVDVLALPLRVPYGVISNRHGKGALPGTYPEQFVEDPANARYVNEGGNISVFASVRRSAKHGLRAKLPGPVPVGFGLAPFLGLMGVARDTDAMVDSVPPTYAGGNLDINDLVVGSTLYLPVQVAGALFFTGDPHMAQGDGEVALTAMEGSLRATLRLSVIKAGSRKVPRIAFDQPFAETPDFWLPIGLSDGDGPEGGGNETSLDLAMKDAVRQALAFLVEEKGMPGPVAYAYLSAATDFQVSQVVDRTTGIHALIRKADFA